MVPSIFGARAGLHGSEYETYCDWLLIGQHATIASQYEDGAAVDWTSQLRILGCNDNSICQYLQQNLISTFMPLVSISSFAF